MAPKMENESGSGRGSSAATASISAASSAITCDPLREAWSIFHSPWPALSNPLPYFSSSASTNGTSSSP